MKIVADNQIPFIEAYFAPHADLILKPGRALTRAEVIDADILIIRSVTPVNAALLENTAVKFVATVTTGIDHLDTGWLDAAGIQWVSAAGYNALPVAEYVIATLAALQIQPQAKIGLVGVGQVGSRVQALCEKLGLTTLVCDPLRAEQEPTFQSQSLEALMTAEVLSLHIPLTDDGPYPTRDLITKLTGPRYLLNTSRGEVVSTQVYAETKDCKWILDVWPDEPNLDPDLLAATLIATPHLAGYSVQCRYRGVKMIYQALCKAYSWQPKTPEASQVPHQSLDFSNQAKTWQEVVLAVFDPRLVSEDFKTTLLKGGDKCATLFDRERQRYIGTDIKRHEFAATTLTRVSLNACDRAALQQLGFTIKE